MLWNIETRLEEMGDRVDGSLLFSIIAWSILNGKEDQPFWKEVVENIGERMTNEQEEAQKRD